jgi:hypothetical protein
MRIPHPRPSGPWPTTTGRKMRPMAATAVKVLPDAPSRFSSVGLLQSSCTKRATISNCSLCSTHALFYLHAQCNTCAFYVHGMKYANCPKGVVAQLACGSLYPPTQRHPQHLWALLRQKVYTTGLSLRMPGCLYRCPVSIQSLIGAR